jgi:hypothetical protein
MPLLDGSANTIGHKLRWLAPAAAAISYPFWLDGFHLAVSPASGPTSMIWIIGAALCLLAAMAVVHVLPGVGVLFRPMLTAFFRLVPAPTWRRSFSPI